MDKIEILKLLNEQQKPAIYSTEKKILVLAGPGSGKTHTLIERLKIITEYKNNKLAKGTIICSFTKNSANDLKIKIEKRGINIENIFIGTLDSFVYDIVNSFKNRWFIYKKNNLKLGNLVKVFPQNNQYKLNGIKDKINEKIGWENWTKELILGNYVFAFPSYLAAKQMIKDLIVLKKYIISKYDSIFIDEVQDLNEHQHQFIEIISKECSLDIFMVGDRNQRLYEWRGAHEYLLEDIIKEYETFYIDQNIRTNENIVYVANKLLRSNDLKNENANILVLNPEKRVYLIGDIEFELLNIANSKGSYFILCDKQFGITEVYKKIVNKINHKLIIIKEMTLNELDEKIELLNQILDFYFNFKNDIKKFIYPFSQYMDMLISDNLIEKINFNKEEKEVLQNIEIEPGSYLRNVMNILNIHIKESTFESVSSFLLNDEYRNKYIRSEGKNKIMTIHASKGLEAKSVFVYNEDNNYSNKLNRSDVWKYYVAFTRAEEYLYIKTKNNQILKVVEDYKNEILNK